MVLKILGLKPARHGNRLGYFMQRYIKDIDVDDLEAPYVCIMDGVDSSFEKCSPLYIKLFDLETPRVVY